MSLDAIKARLGSLAPLKRTRLPVAVQKLLDEDLPRLITVAEAAEKACGRIGHTMACLNSAQKKCSCDAYDLANALSALETP